MKKYDVIIVGGGAAGLAAAVSARKENKNAAVCVIEKSDRVAKKIHATGNGRCNFTNMDIRGEFFYGDSMFIDAVLKSFGTEEALRFFSELGIMHRVEDGRVYPLSNQSSAIADALRLYLNENNVSFYTQTPVMRIDYKKDGFVVGDTWGKKVIVATGGKASPSLGSDGSGYKLLTAFGHRLTAVRAALVSLKTENNITKPLKGVKVFARVTLVENGKTVASDRGEILFTDYGVSGIPVMQISRFATKGMELQVDMLPDLTISDVISELYRRKRLFPEREGCELVIGLVNKKIAIPMLKKSGITKISVKLKDFTDENIRKCGTFLKELKLPVWGDNGLNNAQVCAGGIELCDFSPYTMESKLQKGLYAAGEILDCDAICGGYNLHWAWATGALAGRSAVKNED